MPVDDLSAGIFVSIVIAITALHHTNLYNCNHCIELRVPLKLFHQAISRKHYWLSRIGTVA